MNDAQAAKPLQIGYLSDCLTDYLAGIDKATTLEKLRALTAKYRTVADDAYAICLGMDQASFADFRKLLPKARRKNGIVPAAWLERFSILLLPRVLFEVGMVASRFVVPWGVAYIRMKEFGTIKEAGGIATYHAEQPQNGSGGQA
jgi:hypothetical protein